MKRVYYFVVLLILVSCQNKSTNVSIEQGKVENGIYHNESLKFKVEMPKDWNYLSEQENSDLLQQMNSGEVSSTTTKILLTTLENEQNTGFKANVIVIAEDMTNNNKINSEFGYLMLNFNNLKKTYSTLSPPVISDKKIGNVDVKTMLLKMPEGMYSQEYFVFFEEDIVISIIASYQTEMQHQEIMKSLQTLHLQKLKK